MAARRSRAKKVSSCLPIDLVAEILSKLPVESVIRFSSASQEWHALTTSCLFIAAHHEHFHGLNSNPRLLFRSSTNGGTKGMAQVLFLDNDATISKLDLSFIPDIKSKSITNIIGSCNGLVCLELVDEVDYHLSRMAKKTIIVCNPATKRYRDVPEPMFVGDTITDLFGFFHDFSTGFKLVHVPYKLNVNINQTYEAQVYNQSSNCWRQVTEGFVLPDVCLLYQHIITISGVLYLLALTMHPPFNFCVFPFNLREEVLDQVIPVPASCKGVKDIKFCSWKNSLMLIFTFDAGLELWAISDESGKSDAQVLWTKKFSVRPLPFRCVRLIGFWKDQLIFSGQKGNDDMMVFSLDPTSQNVTAELHKQGVAFCSRGVTYAESLIQV